VRDAARTISDRSMEIVRGSIRSGARVRVEVRQTRHEDLPSHYIGRVVCVATHHGNRRSKMLVLATAQPGTVPPTMTVIGLASITRVVLA
jgi:hypothetical protein